MIANVTLYIHQFGLEPAETLILEAIVSIRMRGKRAQPGWKEMSTWIHRSTRTVARAIGVLEGKGLMRRIRRGKRLTNIYFIAGRLWRRLIAGRKIAYERADKYAAVPIDREKTRALLKQLSESMAKIH